MCLLLGNLLAADLTGGRAFVLPLVCCSGIGCHGLLAVFADSGAGVFVFVLLQAIKPVGATVLADGGAFEFTNVIGGI